MMRNTSNILFECHRLERRVIVGALPSLAKGYTLHYIGERTIGHLNTVYHLLNIFIRSATCVINGWRVYPFVVPFSVRHIGHQFSRSSFAPDVRPCSVLSVVGNCVIHPHKWQTCVDFHSKLGHAVPSTWFLVKIHVSQVLSLNVDPIYNTSLIS